MNYFLVGSACGFGLFVFLLEYKMGSVLFREGIFSPRNLIKFMKSPFNSVFLWYPRLWMHNWVIMVLSGGLIGNIMGNLVENVTEAEHNSTVLKL